MQVFHYRTIVFSLVISTVHIGQPADARIFDPASITQRIKQSPCVKRIFKWSHSFLTKMPFLRRYHAVQRVGNWKSNLTRPIKLGKIIDNSGKAKIIYEVDGRDDIVAIKFKRFLPRRKFARNNHQYLQELQQAQKFGYPVMPLEVHGSIGIAPKFYATNMMGDKIRKLPKDALRVLRKEVLSLKNITAKNEAAVGEFLQIGIMPTGKIFVFDTDQMMVPTSTKPTGNKPWPKEWRKLLGKLNEMDDNIDGFVRYIDNLLQ